MVGTNADPTGAGRRRRAQAAIVWWICNQ